MKIKHFLVIVGLLAVGFPAQAQFLPGLGDQFQLYSCHWNGSITSGTAFTVSVPNATSATKFTYPIGVSIHTTTAVIVTIRTRAATAPTSTATVPVRLSANEDPSFRCYAGSNVSADGGIVTQYPMAAGESQTFPVDGMRFTRGVSTLRNVTVHIPASSGGTAYITWKVGSKGAQ